VSGPSGGGSLRLSWGWSGLDSQDESGSESEAPGATAVEAIKADLKKIAVAYQNAVVKIFDIETGKEVSRLPSDTSYGKPSSIYVFTSALYPLFADGTPATQINRLVSHPTMSLLVTAHEDKFIRIFDIVTGSFSPICADSPYAHSTCRTMYSLNVGSPGRSYFVVNRPFRLFFGVWKSRLLNTFLGPSGFESVRSRDSCASGEGT
jgi:striatin 1/3/4